MLFALIPLATLVVTAVAARRGWLTSGHVDDLIRSGLVAAIAWGSYLVVMTEVLSLFGALSFGWLVAGWSAPLPAVLWMLRRRQRAVERIEPPASDNAQTLDGVQTGLLILLALLVAVTGVVAWASAPNTWDSMTYHLPRVMHWVQGQSIAHYPTHEPRQLYMSPLPELVATHFQILSGGDRFANFVQWLSMVGSLGCVFLLAGRFGAGLDGRILAMVAAATIPMGLLQAVSTQTDHVVGFLMLTAIYGLSQAEEPGRRGWLVVAAAATGLAALAKATAYLFLAPFLAWFAGRLAVRRRLAAVPPLLAFGAVVLVLNLGHSARNLALFDSPLKPRGLGPYHHYSNESFGPRVTLSNALRSAAVHLTLPAPRFVAGSLDAIRRGHELLGLDPEDPRTTWPGMRFEPAPVLVHEDFSGNFVHGVLILTALAALGASHRLRRALPRLALHAALATAAFLLFASYLKWAPWHARLHLSLALLWAPVLGTLIGRLPRPVSVSVAALLFAQAIPFLVANPLHPVQGPRNVLEIPRSEQYFYPRPRLGGFYRDAARRIAEAGCDEVGLSMPPDAWEYPLWVLLKETAARPPRLASLEPDNPSKKLLGPSFSPCAVVCIRCSPHRRRHYAARLGEPVASATSDLSHSPDNLLFLDPGM